MTWIRWPGFAAFVGFVALLLFAWWVLIDVVVERGIEYTGTALVGARVDLASADVSLWPAGIELHRLQVTDPQHPMTNAVEVERIAGLIDGLEALRRKVIVDELAVEGLRFGTARERSGAVRDPEPIAPSAADGGFELPSFDFPSPEQILADENLESVALIANLRGDIEESQVRWKQRLAELPGKEDLDRYQREIDELGGLGSVDSVARAARLAADIQKDLAALKEAAGGFEQELEDLQKRVEQARSAPARDLERLQERYGLSDAGLANLSGRLLGARVRSLVAQALEWYRRLEPFFASASRYANASAGEGPEVVERVRGKSVRVRFREDRPLPDFLIRHAKVSVEVEAGAFRGSLDNVTPDQDILGLPLTLHFAADELDGIDSVRLEGKLDHIQPDRPKDILTTTVRGYEVKDFVLSESESWPISIERGRADFSSHANLEGGAMDVKLDLALASAALKTGFDEGNAIAVALAETLEGISAFALGANVTGSVDAPEVKIRSDLDRSLGAAVKKLVSAQMKEFRGKLGAAIQGEVDGPLADLQGSFGGLKGLDADLEQRLQSGAELLSEAQGGGAGSLKGLKLPGSLRFP